MTQLELYLVVTTSDRGPMELAARQRMEAILLQSLPCSEAGVQLGDSPSRGGWPLARCILTMVPLGWTKLVERIKYMHTLVGDDAPCFRQVVFASQPPPASVMAGEDGVWFAREQVDQALLDGLPQLLFAQGARSFDEGPMKGWSFIPFAGGLRD